MTAGLICAPFTRYAPSTITATMPRLSSTFMIGCPRPMTMLEVISCFETVSFCFLKRLIS